MGTAIFSLLCMALLVVSGLTMSHDFLSTWNITTGEFANLSDRNVQTLHTDISPFSSAVSGGKAILEVSLSNRGQTAIANFDQWDVIVQYYDSHDDYYVKWLPYVTGTPGDNQWTVEGIYLDAEDETPEILGPGILNPGEEIQVAA